MVASVLNTLKDGYDYSNCDTTFRFYWAEHKFSELQHKGNLSLALIPYRSLDTLNQFITQGKILNYNHRIHRNF